MDPLVPQNCYGAAIIWCLLFSSEMSFCQSPGFHPSTMVVLWLLTGAENTLRESLGMGEWKLNPNAHPHHGCFYLWNWWSRHYFKFNAVFASPTFQYAVAPKDRLHLSLTDLLHWLSYWCCLSWEWGLSHLLISECHPVLLLGCFVLPFSEKLNSYLSQVSALASDPERSVIYLDPHWIPSSVITFTLLPVILC